MIRPPLIFWAVGGGLLLAITVGVGLLQTARHPPLPPVARYGNLPDGFARALQAARAGIHSPVDDPEGVRKLARLYQANRLFGEARACYRIIAAAAGLSARDHYYLADLAQNENDLAAAQDELRAVARAEPRYAPARAALGEVLFKSGREDEAAAEYSAALALDPLHPQALLGLARGALQRGDEAAAVPPLEKLVTSHPGAVAGSSLLAQVLERRGEPERAAALRQASRLGHEPIAADPWLEALLVDCYDITRLAIWSEQYLIAGQAGRAERFLDRIEELDPANWVPHAVRGWSSGLAGNHEVAAREYRRALEKGGDAQQICPLLIAPLFALGRAGEAGALLADYHAKMPDSVPILRAYAEVAVRRGDEVLARELLAKVLQAEPYLYEPNMSLAGLLWKHGEKDEAARYLQRVASVFPDDVDSRGMLAQYYLEKGEPGPAIAVLEKAVALLAESAPRRERLVAMLGTTYRMAGSLAAGQGRYEEAVALAAKAIQALPDELRSYALMANACLRLKRFGPAVEALEKMLSLAPGDPTVQLHLGDAVYQAGAKERARELWEKARPAAAADHELTTALALRLAGNWTGESLP